MAGAGASGLAAGSNVDPATAEASQRAAVALVDLAHIDLNVIVVRQPDQALVDAVERARVAAHAAGRDGLLENAARAARNEAMRAFSRSGFSGTWAATDMAASVARPGDRVAAAAAFEAAVVAALTEDLVDDGTLAVLRERTDNLERATGLPQPGSLSTFASPRGAIVDAVPVGLGIAVVIAGILATLALGTIAAGLVVIALGFAAVGAIGRGRSAD